MSIIKVSDCLFCQIINKKKPTYIIAENDNCLAFLDVFPASEGHILIVTKKHYDNISQIEQNDWNYLLSLIKEVVNKLQITFKPQGFNFISNMGEMAYQSIFHFHLHIIPKYRKEQGFIWTVDSEKTIDLKKIAKKISS